MPKQFLLSIIMLLLSWQGIAVGQTLPLWEFGMGLAALHLPYYRGANSSRNYAIPFPHITYRGERLNIDDGEVTGRIFRSDRVKLDISLAGGVPVASDGETPRVGMPDLDPTGELGPSLEVRLWRAAARPEALWLKLPARAALSVGDRGLRHQGWVFAPYLEYALDSRAPGRWETSLSGGPLFASRDYHNYFYEVDPAYSTGQRPEYHASGGYSGSRLTLTAQRKIGDLWIGAFYRVDTLTGSVFRNSPLVNTDRYQALGFAMSWVFARSRDQVESGRLIEIP